MKPPFDHTGGGMVPVKMPLDDPEVAGVRTEQEVRRVADQRNCPDRGVEQQVARHAPQLPPGHAEVARLPQGICPHRSGRSEEHTSELQSLMRISYAFFCFNNKYYPLL